MRIERIQGTKHAQYLERIKDLHEPPPDAVVLPMDRAYYELLPALVTYEKNHAGDNNGHYSAGHHG